MKQLLQILLVPILALLVSCSKTPGSAGYDKPGMTSHGLGGFSHFAGQEAGESYTTDAPHNQLYLFSYDDAELNEKYLASIHAQAQYLRSHPGARILLGGHTDERGSREYNISLGEKRANAVAAILRAEGVASQIRIVSYGKQRPINLGHDAASHAQNRRVELLYESTYE